MTMFAEPQVYILYTPNIITGLCYAYILFSILRSQDLEKSPRKNRVLFAAFIGTCGMHHFLHWYFMYFNPSFAVLLSIDSVMAVIAVLSVKEMDF